MAFISIGLTLMLAAALFAVAWSCAVSTGAAVPVLGFDAGCAGARVNPAAITVANTSFTNIFGEAVFIVSPLIGIRNPGSLTKIGPPRVHVKLFRNKRIFAEIISFSAPIRGVYTPAETVCNTKAALLAGVPGSNGAGISMP
jgi:hypothetical protein